MWSLGPARVSYFSDHGNVPGIIEFYRRSVTGEQHSARPLLVILPDVAVTPPPGLGVSNVQARDGRVFNADAIGRVTLRADDAAPLIRAGWQVGRISMGPLDAKLEMHARLRRSADPLKEIEHERAA